MVSRPGDISPGAHPDRSTAPRYWTVADLLTWTEGYFRKLGLPTPRLDAEVLLAHAMGTTRLELYTGYRKVAEEDERARFRALVERRSRFEPVAYILGFREFYSLEFEVNPAVLIPRPDTEHLVDHVLEEMNGGPERPLILDLGTGSGNIAVALLVHLPAARVVATDVSPEAVEVARRNALRHGVAERMDLRVGDLFGAVSPPGRGAEAHAGFDAIVCNPPYVSLSEHPRLMPDVRDHEPSKALLDTRSGTGTGFYRELAASGAAFLRAGGLLAVEVGARQGGEVERLLAGSGWTDIRSRADYAGIPRVVSARSPKKDRSV